MQPIRPSCCNVIKAQMRQFGAKCDVHWNKFQKTFEISELSYIFAPDFIQNNV
jgi:hypothetical protein